jgi:hypothetical protein
LFRPPHNLAIGSRVAVSIGPDFEKMREDGIHRCAFHIGDRRANSIKRIFACWQRTFGRVAVIKQEAVGSVLD